MKELFWYYKAECRYNPSWHYAHGEAESFLGHDIPVTHDDWLPPLGRSRVILTNAAGVSRIAFCFSWISVEKVFGTVRTTQRGLIVFMSDRDSVAYASQCYMNKVNRL